MSTLNRLAKVPSLQESARESIRKAIIKHELKAGTRLVEAKISKELGVSITPIRSAFSDLSVQGLLTVLPYRGTFVKIITKEYVRDVFDLREVLEVKAAELGFHELCDEDVQYLDDLIVQSDFAMKRDDVYTSIQCDVSFHEKLFTLSNNDLLMQMWYTIKHRIEYIQSYSKPATQSVLSIRHGPMMESIRERDLNGYIEALREHLHSSFYSVEFMENKDVQYH
ncbi:MAG: GntR family transcriptional regulator [Christensenellales bacterium]|jgi:DNA-binding GntR family transcriptional regulator